MKHPRPRFTLAELMGLVALCAVGFALLTTSFALMGIGVLVVVPGFVLERARGGTGIIGGMISGCVLPAMILFPAAVLQLYLTDSSASEYLNLFPALYLLFVLCLVWSGILSSVLYLVDRRLLGQPRVTGPPAFDEGIRFLPDDGRAGQVPETGRPYPPSGPVPRRGSDR